MKSTDRGGSRKGSKETESTMTWKEKAALKRLERKIRNGHGEVSPEVLMEYAERVMKEEGLGYRILENTFPLYIVSEE